VYRPSGNADLRGDDVRRVLTVGVAVCAAVLVMCGTAAGAGIVTHAWMADDARAHVGDARLRALLGAHRDQLRSGAAYPDSGYVMSRTPGGDYGEEAHWQRFVQAYADRLRARRDCGDLHAADGPCAPEVAHLMGVAAHGMGDEVWDWLYEPVAADHDERYVLPALSDGTGTEFPMDMIAVLRHHRPTGPVPLLPSVPDLLAAYAAVGRSDVKGPPNVAGNAFSTSQLGAEAKLAVAHGAKVAVAMPWTSTHMVVAPGGVTFAAKAIAGYYDTVWSRLLGTTVATRVSETYPADGERGVPATGWDRATFSPGAAADRGGASTRIVAVLTSATPFAARSGGTGFEPVAAGALTLSEVGPGDAETPVPVRAGYPRTVPYGGDAGQHLVDLQPDGNLAPCTWYRVRTTASLVDATHAPVTAATWSFRTGAAGGGACADDPAAAPAIDPAAVAHEPIQCLVAVTVRTPAGARAVTVTVGKVRHRLGSGRRTVSLPAGARATLRATVRGRARTATRTLARCGAKVGATALTVR
jgi:hypothetical protein